MISPVGVRVGTRGSGVKVENAAVGACFTPGQPNRMSSIPAPTSNNPVQNCHPFLRTQSPHRQQDQAKQHQARSPTDGQTAPTRVVRQL
ncbi:MAG: hypothetical protein GY842_11505 [bacterium]|nr:hypothetical protein [bacterium]